MHGLLIDLDDTLLDDRAATAQAFSAFVQAHADRLAGRPAEALVQLWRDLARRHWARFEAGDVSFQGQRRDRVRAFLDEPLGDAEADAAFEPYRCAYEQAWRAFADVPAFLARTAHLPKVIVTNGERAQQLKKVAAAGLLPHVRAVVTPEDCGAWKPAAGIFTAALQALALPAQDCTMIGDDPARDIAPARALGMRCFHVDRAAGRDLAAVPLAP